VNGSVVYGNAKLHISHFVVSQERANIPAVQLCAVYGCLIRSNRHRQENNYNIITFWIS